jgi:hypothetical protein
MRKFNPTRAVVLLVSMPVLLAGCTWLLMRDFQKGTEVAELDIGKVHALTKTVALPKGEADLAFVVRDYDCKEPLGASISVKIQFSNGGGIQRDVNLDELTWPVSGRECRPIGYLRLEDAASTRPLRIMIGRESNPVSFSIDVTQAADVGRQMSIWVVYRNRSPVDRMLGARDIKGP